MDDTQHSKRETGVRMRDFFAENPVLNNALFTELSTELNQLLTDVDAIAGTLEASDGAAREGTVTRAAAREALREDLEAINQTARAIAETRPGFANQFRLPEGNNDGALVDAGLGFGESAAPDVALFLSFGLSANFLQELRDSVAALQQSIAGQAERVADRKAAAVQLDDKLDRIMIIRRQMDALVKNAFRDDPRVLSLWTSAKHITRRRRGSSGTGGTPSTPPTGTP